MHVIVTWEAKRPQKPLRADEKAMFPIFFVQTDAIISSEMQIAIGPFFLRSEFSKLERCEGIRISAKEPKNDNRILLRSVNA